VNASNYAQSVNTQLPWDDRTVTESQGISHQHSPQRAQESHITRNRSIGPIASERGYPPTESGHTRNGSVPSAQFAPPGQYSAPAQYSSLEYQEPQPPVIRRHDYDVQSMETSLGSPRPVIINPIPAPVVTVRSEFPTLNKSRQQQSLTCLVTVEVPHANHRATPMDMGMVAPFSSGAASDHSGMRSPTGVRSPVPPPFTPQLQESPEELERITEELHNRVENWHGLDFSRYFPSCPASK
jgi:hypothetical protein